MIQKLLSKIKSLFLAGRRLLVVQSRRAATNPYITTQSLNNSSLILSSAIAASLIGIGTGTMGLAEALMVIAFGIGSSAYSLNKDFPQGLDHYERMIEG